MIILLLLSYLILRSIILRINQALLDLDSKQIEALIQPHQARAFGIMIYDCTSCHLTKDDKPGGQHIWVSSDTLPLHFDGWKCYLRIKIPSIIKMKTLPIFELTSHFPYKAQRINRLCRVDRESDGSVDEWHARLGYPTYETSRNTLKNSTQMGNTLQVDSREYLKDYNKTKLRTLRP